MSTETTACADTAAGTGGDKPNKLSMTIDESITTGHVFQRRPPFGHPLYPYPPASYVPQSMPKEGMFNYSGWKRERQIKGEIM